MLAVKFTGLQIEEVAHKMCIVRDEPELQESYGISQADADFLAELFLRAAPGIVTFDQKFRDTIAGEIEDGMLPMLANWQDCGDQCAGGIYRSMSKALAAVRAA